MTCLGETSSIRFVCSDIPCVNIHDRCRVEAGLLLYAVVVLHPEDTTGSRISLVFRLWQLEALHSCLWPTTIAVITAIATKIISHEWICQTWKARLMWLPTEAAAQTCAGSAEAYIQPNVSKSTTRIIRSTYGEI